MTNSTTDVVGAYPPPAGVTPNFTNPESIGYRVILAALLCPAIAIPFLLLRLYTRRFLIKCLHLDDCTSSFRYVDGLELTRSLDSIVLALVDTAFLDGCQQR
jgi:hypothetical protein